MLLAVEFCLCIEAFIPPSQQALFAASTHAVLLFLLFVLLLLWNKQLLAWGGMWQIWAFVQLTFSITETLRWAQLCVNLLIRTSFCSRWAVNSYNSLGTRALRSSIDPSHPDSCANAHACLLLQLCGDAVSVNNTGSVTFMTSEGCSQAKKYDRLKGRKRKANQRDVRD